MSEAGRSAAKGQGLRSENLSKFGWFVGDNMGTAGLIFLIRSVAFASLRVVRPTGHFVVFCDWRQAPNLSPAVESAGWRFQGHGVWDKGHMGLGVGFRAQHEFFLHFTAGAPEYHARDVPNVIRCPRVGEDREHQTEKPVQLLRKIVRVVAPPGGVVLDPFCGSGSTGVAALREGRAFVGVEREAAHVATARRRLTGTALSVAMGEDDPDVPGNVSGR